MNLYEHNWNRDSETHMEHKPEDISHLRTFANWEKELVEDNIERADHEPLLEDEQ